MKLQRITDEKLSVLRAIMPRYDEVTEELVCTSYEDAIQRIIALRAENRRLREQIEVMRLYGA